MAENKKVYILEEITGEYDDKHTRVLSVFFDHDKAVAECQRLTEEYDKIREEYDSIDYDVDMLKDDIFKDYLKDINEELYEEVLRAEKDDKYSKEFDWDKYYDARDEFYLEEELFDEYKDKHGCTEQQKHDIEIMDYVTDEIGYDFPFFYVSHYPVDLIE